MDDQKRIIVLNPGSSSFEAAYYTYSETEGVKEICTISFESEEKAGGKKSVKCIIKRADGTKQELPQKWNIITQAMKDMNEILQTEGLISKEHPLDGVAVRVVPSSDYYIKSHVVDEVALRELEKIALWHPVHAPSAINTIKFALSEFRNVPVVVVSDSEPLVDPDARSNYEYPFSDEIRKYFSAKMYRYGAHGNSDKSIIETMRKEGLPEAELSILIMHLGSGCSGAIYENGKPVGHTMGFTPDEGMMSSTRSGSVAPSIPIVVTAKKIAKKLRSLSTVNKPTSSTNNDIGKMIDSEIKQSIKETMDAFNKKSGLMAMAGTPDMKEILDRADKGDQKAIKAREYFIKDKARMAAGLIVADTSKAEVDALVFTATIGVRSMPIVRSIVKRLKAFGFEMRDDVTNDSLDLSKGYANVAAKDSKPIYVIPTKETDVMAARTFELLGIR